MKKIISLSLLILILVSVSCSINSNNRGEIVNWAYKISRIQLALERQIAQIEPVIESLTINPPTAYEINRLLDFSNNLTSLYNEVVEIDAPQEVKKIHSKYIEKYSQISNYGRYYYLAISQNNIDYFDKSILAVQEANRIGDEAYNDFVNILTKYSISCEEIDFCE